MKKWWKRQTPFGWSLGYFSLNELKAVYLRGFKLVSKQIGRKEGVSLAPAIFKKDPEARMFFRIRTASQITRKFKNNRKYIKKGVYYDGDWRHCYSDEVTVAKEVTAIPDISSFIPLMIVRDEGRKTTLKDANVSLTQTKDQTGAYLYVIPKYEIKDLEISISALPKKQFTTIGRIFSYCEPLKKRIISNEKQLLIKVETFVEKL